MPEAPDDDDNGAQLDNQAPPALIDNVQDEGAGEGAELEALEKVKKSFTSMRYTISILIETSGLYAS